MDTHCVNVRWPWSAAWAWKLRPPMLSTKMAPQSWDRPESIYATIPFGILSCPILSYLFAWLPIYLSTYLPTNQSIDQSIDQSINHYPSILVILSRSYVLCPIGNILFPVSYPSKYLCRERGNNVGELERTWSTSKDILRSLCSWQRWCRGGNFSEPNNGRISYF